MPCGNGVDGKTYPLRRELNMHMSLGVPHFLDGRLFMGGF
jgi:hypothetical protein